MISGCRDDQTSADAWVENDRKFEGALTWGFLESVEELITEPKLKNTFVQPTWRDLLCAIRKHMFLGNYDQLPQLSVCKRVMIWQDVDI